MVDSYIVWLCVSELQIHDVDADMRDFTVPIGTNLSFLTIAGNKALASIE
jgi:hypothetical protein